MCRRFIHARVRRGVISQNFFPLTAKKRRFFLREMCSIFSLGRSTYSLTALRETDDTRKEKDTPHTYTQGGVHFSLFFPSRAIYVR